MIGYRKQNKIDLFRLNQKQIGNPSSVWPTQQIKEETNGSTKINKK